MTVGFFKMPFLRFNYIWITAVFLWLPRCHRLPTVVKGDAGVTVDTRVPFILYVLQFIKQLPGQTQQKPGLRALATGKALSTMPTNVILRATRKVSQFSSPDNIIQDEFFIQLC